MHSATASRWKFWIVPGGAFIDTAVQLPDVTILAYKILSENPKQYGDAAFAGIGRLLDLMPDERITPALLGCVRIGTMVAMNVFLVSKSKSEKEREKQDIHRTEKAQGNLPLIRLNHIAADGCDAARSRLRWYRRVRRAVHLTFHDVLADGHHGSSSPFPSSTSLICPRSTWGRKAANHSHHAPWGVLGR